MGAICRCRFRRRGTPQATAVHREIYQEFASKIEWATNGPALIDFSYSIVDLDVGLPFKSQHFDKIVSNLVLSYVKDPLFTLREMWRTLKEGRTDCHLQFEASRGPFSDIPKLRFG